MHIIAFVSLLPIKKKHEILGSHGGEGTSVVSLGCNAVWTARYIPARRRNTRSAASALQSTRRHNPEQEHRQKLMFPNTPKYSESSTDVLRALEKLRIVAEGGRARWGGHKDETQQSR